MGMCELEYKIWIDGTSECISYSNEDTITIFSYLRRATAKEIHEAFSKIPGVILGSWQGVTFYDRR